MCYKGFHFALVPSYHILLLKNVHQFYHCCNMRICYEQKSSEKSEFITIDITKKHICEQAIVSTLACKHLTYIWWRSVCNGRTFTTFWCSLLTLVAASVSLLNNKASRIWWNMLNSIQLATSCNLWCLFILLSISIKSSFVISLLGCHTGFWWLRYWDHHTEGKNGTGTSVAVIWYSWHLLGGSTYCLHPSDCFLPLACHQGNPVHVTHMHSSPCWKSIWQSNLFTISSH